MGSWYQSRNQWCQWYRKQTDSRRYSKAKAVIIAADKAVEMDRFDGKPLINRPVADGIRKTEELINLALSGKSRSISCSQ